MFLVSLTAVMLVGPQLSPITATFGTPAMVLRGDWFQLTPDGKFVTDGITWIDLATEKVVPRSVRIIEKDLRALLAEHDWVCHTMMANENWVRWDTDSATLLDGKTREVLSTVEDQVSAVDPSGRLLARTEFLVKAEKARTAIQVASWPKAGEKPKWRTLTEHDGDLKYSTSGVFDRTGESLAWKVDTSDVADECGVHVHHFETGKTVRLKVEDDSIPTYGLAISPGGKTVAVVRRRETHLFDVASGKSIRTVPHPGGGYDEMSPTIAFTPDGANVLFDGLHRRRIERIPCDPKIEPGFIDVSDGDGVYTFAITPDSKRMVVRDDGGVIRVYDLATGKRQDRGTHETWTGVAWTGENKAACWSGRGQVAIWDTRTGKIERQLSLGRPLEKSHGVTNLTLSPDGKLAAVEEDVIDGETALIVYDLATGKAVWELPHWLSVQHVTFHPDGDKIGFDTIDFREPNWGDRRFRVYHIQDRKEVQAFPSKTGDCLFSDDGRAVFQGWDSQTEQTVQCFEIASGKSRWVWNLKLEKPSSSGRLLGVDAKENLVWMAAGDRVTGLDLTKGTVRWSMERLPVGGGLSPFASTPDGRWLAAQLTTRDDKKNEREMFAVYDLRTQAGRDCQLVSPPLARSIQGMALSPDGQRLITLAQDGEQAVWDLNHLRRMTTPWAHLWDGLSGDVGPAAVAMSQLVATSDWAVELLGEKLPPTAEPNAEQVKRWLGELGSSDFKTRNRSERQLNEVLDTARALILAAAEEPVNAEAGERLERLVKRIDGLNGESESLRVVRAVEVVERLRTPAAVKLLERWASGAPGALLTTEAKASLKRIKK